MGLDMYLYKRKKLRENDEEYNTLIRENSEEVMYWRKANQIRRWIVDHTEYDDDSNCEFFELTKDDLVALRDDCLRVLGNGNLAREIMPTSEGFFFGCTNYDAGDGWYLNTLEHTVEELNKILETTDFETEAIDYYEWW